MYVKFSESDNFFMRRALELAQKAKGTTFPNPAVGAVIVNDYGKIIGEGATGVCGGPHAEKRALRKAGAAARGATMYVTLEPCPMCAFALVLAEVSLLVYGLDDPRLGACGSLINLLQFPGFDRNIAIRSGLYAEDSGQLLQAFFAKRR